MRKPAVIAVILLVVLATVLWFYGRPGYRRYKERQHLHMAQRSMREGQHRTAWLSVQQVLALNSTNLEACRMSADLTDLFHSQAAVGWRRKVAELAPTLENRLMLASCALQYEPPPFPLTTETLESISDQASGLTAFHVVSAARALRLNLTSEAERHLQDAMRLEPTNSLHGLNLAVLRLQSTNSAAVANARSKLQTLSTDREYGLAALRSLAADSLNRQDWPAAVQFSNRVLANTNASFSDRIQHLTILFEAGSSKLALGGEGTTGPSAPNAEQGEEQAARESSGPVVRGPVVAPQFEAYLASLKTLASTNVGNIADLAGWLNGHAKAADTIAWLNALSADIRTLQPLPLLMADAYMIQNDWRTLENWVRDQKWDDQECLRFAILSRAMRSQGEPEVSKINWNKAVRAATDRPELLPTLANVALGWGWTAEVEQVLWASARQYPDKVWALQSLEKAYYFRGNTRALLNVYAALFENRPKDPLARNNLATVSLLLKTNIDQAQVLARDVYTQNQTNAVVASTYAFSLYLQGKTAEGIAILRNLKEEDLRRSTIAVYYAVLLNAAGEKDKASTYRQFAERGPLLPEERALLADVGNR